jgi:hypothetical protein
MPELGRGKFATFLRHLWGHYREKLAPSVEAVLLSEAPSTLKTQKVRKPGYPKTLQQPWGPSLN